MVWDLSQRFPVLCYQGSDPVSYLDPLSDPLHFLVAVGKSTWTISSTSVYSPVGCNQKQDDHTVQFVTLVRFDISGVLASLARLRTCITLSHSKKGEGAVASTPKIDIFAIVFC